MISRQKIKYIPNKIKKRIASSNSPTIKYVQIKKSFKETSKNKKNNSLNKSREKYFNYFPHTGLNSFLNLSQISIPNKNAFKKKNLDNSLNTSSNFQNNSFSMQNSMIKLNKTKKSNSNSNYKNNNNKIIMKKNNMINKPQKILNLNMDFNISKNTINNNSNTTENYENNNNINKLNFNKEFFKTNFLSNKKNEILKCKIVKNENNEKKIITEDNSLLNVIENKEKINSSNKFFELEEKLKSKLSENKLANRIILYNTYKSIFEEVIKILPNNQKNLFNLILYGYQDIILGYSNDEKELNKKNEKYQNRIKILEKENLESNVKLYNKELEINEWKKKIKIFLEKSPEQISKSTNYSFIITSSNKEKEIHKRKKKNTFIEHLNRNNYKDLDALYFNDKVFMKSKSKSPFKSNKGEIIPFLDLNIDNKRIENKIKKININKKGNNKSFIQKVAMSLNLK